MPAKQPIISDEEIATLSPEDAIHAWKEGDLGQAERWQHSTARLVIDLDGDLAIIGRFQRRGYPCRSVATIGVGSVAAAKRALAGVAPITADVAAWRASIVDALTRHGIAHTVTPE